MYRRGEVGQVARALRVLDALRGFKRGRWVTEVAVEVDASERTVHRDITELQLAGFDIETSRQNVGNRSFACLVTERTYSPVSVTKRERFTLLAVRDVFDVFQGTPFLDDVHSVMTKLEQRMSDHERAEHATFGDRFAYMPDGGVKNYRGKEDVLDALLTGVLQRKLVKFAFQGVRSRARHGFLAPYAMVLHKHAFSMLGVVLRDPDEVDKLADREVELFAADRFTEADHVRRATFITPSSFKLAEYMHGAFGPQVGKQQHEIAIEFSKERATYARTRTWHPRQRVEERPDGSLVLHFTASNLLPVISWILEWGPQARALNPPQLVEAVVAELDNARFRYP